MKNTLRKFNMFKPCGIRVLTQDWGTAHKRLWFGFAGGGGGVGGRSLKILHPRRGSFSLHKEDNLTHDLGVRSFITL